MTLITEIVTIAAVALLLLWIACGIVAGVVLALAWTVEWCATKVVRTYGPLPKILDFLRNRAGFEAWLKWRDELERDPEYREWVDRERKILNSQWVRAAYEADRWKAKFEALEAEVNEQEEEEQ